MSDFARQTRPRSARRRYRLWIAGASALALTLAAVALWRATNYEAWLDRQPTESLRRLDEQEENNTLAHLVYARRQIEAGLGSAADAPAERALASLAPDSPSRLRGRVYALAGYVAARKGEVYSAEDYLRRASSLQRDDPLLHLAAGTLALHQHHLNDAVDSLDRATRLAPNMVPAWSGLGAAWLMGAEPERALAAYRRLVALVPRSARAHAGLADALGACRRFRDALREYRQAESLAPEDPAYVDRLATATATYARTETEYNDAAARLSTLLASDASNPRLHALLGGLHMRFGRYAKAQQEIEASLSISPDVANEWQDLAVACDRDGDRRAGAAAQQRAYTLFDAQMQAARISTAIAKYSEGRGGERTVTGP